MNKEIKINELREKGYGYKRIGKEVSIKPEAVRYICRKIDKVALIGTCKKCGKQIKSIKGKKKKIFCSDKCRWKWWNEQRIGLSKNDLL